MPAVSAEPECSWEERRHHRMQVVYARKMRERRIFLDELTTMRRKRDQERLRYVKRLVGPKWYQALSVQQRAALDNLKPTIPKDLLEGVPRNSMSIVKCLGIYPLPKKNELMNCVYLGRKDPKEVLAQLFFVTYGHFFDIRESSYSLNARLMLSAIYYLGLSDLIKMLRERFKPDKEEKEVVVKKEVKVKCPLASPYLEKMHATMYEKPKKKPFKPLPMPNLESINEPWEEKIRVYKVPPIPPPPPPPKNRLPISYCDQMAGVANISPYYSPISMKMIPTRKTPGRTSLTRKRQSKMNLQDFKKASPTRPKKKKRRPVAPNTGLWNLQYMINGVYTINGKTVYVLGNVTGLTSTGNIIHGGHKSMGDENINIHCGYKEQDNSLEYFPCNCLSNWSDAVFNYVRTTKCYCGHNYDYRHKEKFPDDELRFFEKPTRHGPLQFNYDRIYNLDPKSIHVEKEFTKLWAKDSVLQANSGLEQKVQKKRRRTSSTCLGQNPEPEDYLRCALRYMENLNIAAKLPDVYMAPELKEWMRNRIYGPLSRMEKKRLIGKSHSLWQLLNTPTARNLERVHTPKDPSFSRVTDWFKKSGLNTKFKKQVDLYKIKFFQSHAFVSNLLWTTMFQPECPDKSFREIYFSYVYSKIGDIHLINPYNVYEAMERYNIMLLKTYHCLPKGAQDIMMKGD